MDAISSPLCETVVVKASAQTGKSEVILCAIGYYMHQDPSPMLLIQPGLDLAEAFSKDRLAPMIRDCPVLSGKISDVKSRNSNNTLLHKKFAGGHITLAGSNSPSSLASRPIRVVLLDEVSRYPRSAGPEGDPVNLAKKRATTFFNRKFVEVSTPTIANMCRISFSYSLSDQRQFWVPCPHCKEAQVLKWAQVKWNDDDATTAHYLCEACQAPIYEEHKIGMLRAGEWRAQSEFKGVAGFHISELYSPWSPWAKVVKDFLDSKDDPEKLKVWVNTSLGEEWQEKGDAPDWERIYRRRENYPIGRVPMHGLFLTCGVDIQEDRIEAEIVAWGRGKESWSVDYRRIEGKTNTKEPWEKLSELLGEHFEHETGAMMPIRRMAVDTGYNTQHVYEWVRRHSASRVMAVKGSDRIQLPVATPSFIDMNVNGVKMKRGLSLWHVGSSHLKSELYSLLKLDAPLNAGDPFPKGFCHFPEYSEEFFKMITGEQLVSKKVKGYTRLEWQKVRDRNEALDCRIYSRAAASVVGLDRFKDHNWAALEGEIGVSAPKVESSEATPQLPKAPNIKKPGRRKSSFL